MGKAELVFRSVGERTSDLALELAIRAVDPAKVHVIENVRPFSAALQRMLRLRHESDHVVYVDADCLIFDDLRPWLARTCAAYVDCFVTDRFRGRIHCGVHVTRADLVRAMAEVPEPEDDAAYVLRPESRLRNLALKRLGLRKELRNFDIYHDFFQRFTDVFAKYAVRELRSRTPHQLARLELAMGGWPDGSGSEDFVVARRAVAHARAHVPERAAPTAVAAYIEALPGLAEREVADLGLHDPGPLTSDEVEAYRRAHPEAVFRREPGPKVFGIGLSRTGTRSLTVALQTLGLDVLHYPADAVTFRELASGHSELSLLEDHDGVTDITVAPYFAGLDRCYPGSKFVLTVRETESWLASARNHWKDRDAFQPTRNEEEATYMNVRRLLRAAVYGCYGFDEERFRWIAKLHERNVREHFAGRANDLLVLDVCGGDGWDELCAFLGRPAPRQPFPHKGKGLGRRARGVR